MLFILHARWIIKTKRTIIKDIRRVRYKADNNQEAWIACHLIFSGLTQFEQQKLYSGNDVQEEGTEPWWWCCESYTSLSSVQS